MRYLLDLGIHHRVCSECGASYNPILERGDVRCTWGEEVTFICWGCAREMGKKVDNPSRRDIINRERNKSFNSTTEKEYIDMDDIIEDERRIMDNGVLREFRELINNNVEGGGYE